MNRPKHFHRLKPIEKAIWLRNSAIRSGASPLIVDRLKSRIINLAQKSLDNYNIYLDSYVPDLCRFN